MRKSRSSSFTPLERITKSIRAHSVRKRSSLTGFTFLEIIIVILVIGILMATAAPRFISLREESLKAVEDATISALQSGIHSLSAIKN